MNNLLVSPKVFEEVLKSAGVKPQFVPVCDVMRRKWELNMSNPTQGLDDNGNFPYGSFGAFLRDLYVITIDFGSGCVLRARQIGGKWELVFRSHRGVRLPLWEAALNKASGLS